MRFKQVFLSALFSCLFLSCTEDSGGVLEIEAPPMGIEEITQVVNQINYVGVLPDGQTIDFRPSNYIHNGSNSYTNVESMNFTDAPDDLILKASLLSGTGDLKIFLDNSNSIDRVQFQYVFITTLGALEDMFPDELEVDSFFEDWIYAFALGNESLSIEDFINQSNLEITDWLVLYGNPDDNSQAFGFYYEESNNIWFDLDGSYSYQFPVFESNGGVLDYNFQTQTTEIIGGYELSLRE